MICFGNSCVNGDALCLGFLACVIVLLAMLRIEWLLVRRGSEKRAKPK